MKKLTLLCLAVLLWSSAADAKAAELPRLVIDSGGHMGFIRDLLFTSDGRFVVSAGDDKVIRIWDTETGKPVRTIRGQIGEGEEGKISALALSPDDRYLAVGGYFPGSPEERGAIRVYDFKSGEMVSLLKGHLGEVLSLAFSKDGRRLVSGADAKDKTVRIWDVSDPQHMSSFLVLPGHTNGVFCVAFSVDGKRVASTSRDTTIRLWDAEKQTQGKVLNVGLRHRREEVDALSFSPDGRYLVTGSRAGSLSLWDVKEDLFIRELWRQPVAITRVRFSGDGKRILVARDKLGGGLILDLSSKRVVYLKHETPVAAAAFSPDERMIAKAGGGTIGILLHNSANGKTIKVLTGDGQAMQAVGFARNEGSIAFGRMRKFDKTRPLNQSVLLKQEGSYKVEFGSSVSRQSDYQRALQSANGYTLRVSQTRIKARNESYYHWKLFVSSRGQTKLLDTKNSEEPHVIQTLTPDGRYAIDGAQSGFLHRYKTAGTSADKPLEFLGHTNRILSLAVSPDNKTLLSGSNDQTMKLWDIETGHNLLTIFVGADEEWVAWTPQGYYASSLHGDKYVGWHINQGSDKAAKYYRAAQFQKDFYRPDVVNEYLETRDIEVAVQRANDRRKEAGFVGPALDASDINGLLPPSIEVISPKERESTVGNKVLNVRAIIRSATLPITKVKVFLNGSPQGSFAGNSNNSELDLQIRLEPGSNTLAIIAFNEQSYSAPEIRKINYLPSRTKVESDGVVAPLTNNSDLRFESEVKYLKAHAPRGTGQVLQDSTRPAQEPSPQSGARPPEVVVIQPDALESEVEGQTLTVKATGFSYTSPITQIKVSLNGKENIAKFDSDANRQEAEMQVNLEPGMNVLSITAFNKESASEPQTRKVISNASSTTSKPDLIFLGIGISTYQHSAAGTGFQNLSFADRDVAEVAKTFEKQNTLQPQASRVFGSVRSKIIPNAEATKEAILNGLKWMSDEAKKNSNNTHILYLAGHGGMDENENYYFYSHQHVPDMHPDNHNVQWSTIMSSLINAPGKSVIFIDTCHAGATRSYTNLLAVHKKYAADFVGVYTFMASDSNGVSIEKPEFQHGVFTKVVLDGLGGAADLPPKDGKIDVDELGRYVRKEVLKLADKQRAGYLNTNAFDELILFSNPN